MPAPVPPGYTRGPILFLGAQVDPTVEQSLHQWLWREAGGYGARLVLMTSEPARVEATGALHELFASWECDQVAEIVALDRASARNSAHVASVEQATGIVLVGDDPTRWAALLGGTQLAQAIRRANARSKLVAAIGAVGAFLCQHAISPALHPTSSHPPSSYSATASTSVTFGPGLGLVNRLVVDATTTATSITRDLQTRLHMAVAANPFLIGVGLTAGSAAILYPDNTLQAIGPNPVTILDGQRIEAADLEADTDSTLVGALHYTLHTGAGFNLDDHTLRPAGEVDLPSAGPVTSVF